MHYFSLLVFLYTFYLTETFENQSAFYLLIPLAIYIFYLVQWEHICSFLFFFFYFQPWATQWKSEISIRGIKWSVKYFKIICKEIKVLVTVHSLLDNKLLNYAKTEWSLRSETVCISWVCNQSRNNDLHATYINILVPFQRKWIGQLKYS